MKRAYLCGFFFCAFALCLMAAGVAEASMKAKLINKTTRKISVALRYLDAVSDSWVTRGWWSVEPLTERVITISTNNTVAYFYGTAGKSWWGAKAGENGAAQLPIVGNKFLVKGNFEPQGNNPRTVWFRKTSAKNRVFSITFKGN